MNVDLIRVLLAVATVGVGLAGLMLASLRALRHEVRGLRHETREDIQGLRQETRQEIQGLRQEMRDMRSHMRQVDSHIGELRERMAHVEGLLTGLRNAFVRRTVPE